MTQSMHPPREHNPHVWAELAPTVTESVTDEGDPVVHHVIPSHVEGEPETELREQVPAATPTEEITGALGDVVETVSEGGEQPSQTPSTPETAESDGTDSSPSSSTGEKSDASGGKSPRSRARGAGSRSGPADKTE